MFIDLIAFSPIGTNRVFPPFPVILKIASEKLIFENLMSESSLNLNPEE